MPDYKPVVIYDFAEGHMAERLTAQAVEALKDYGYSNAAQELFMEMNRYLKNKSPIDAEPKHMFPIFAKYVEIWPTSYFDMEKVVGKELAREWIPRKDLMPDLVWTVQDYLEANKEGNEEVLEGYRYELDDFISCQLGSKQDFFTIAAKWLHRADPTVSAVEALTFVTKKAKKKTTEPAKVAA